MAARALKSIAHPLRLKILCVVGDQESCVQEIVDAVGTSQSNISQHLAILREKGVPQAAATDPTDTFSGTLLHSIKVLGHGARVTGLVLTALLPFVVVFGGIGLVAWFVARRVRRGRRQPAQPSLPA